MDSAAAQVPAPVVDPLTVGREFVPRYYHILNHMPEHLHRFYQEHSQLGRAGQDGAMCVFSSLLGIREELKKLTYGGYKLAEITSYDTQESLNGGFLLVVNGYFTLHDRLKSKFTQTFFLAPQENGYFVLNDIFRFVSEPEAMDFGTPTAVNAPTGNQGSEQAGCVSVNPVCNKVNNENVSVAEENVLVPEIINKEVPDIQISCKEIADDCDSDDGLKDVTRKSYASVLKVTKDKTGASGGSALSPKQIPKDQDHQVSSNPLPKQILKDQDHQASSDPSPEIESDAVSEPVDATENGNNQVFEDAEGTSVYVKHLPTNATIDMLEAEFKQFGAICRGGIQVISQKGFGFPFGFVEFEEAIAAQKAIEASPVIIGGQRAFVEEKLSTSRGNRGSGNGYGNSGVRGRGRASYGYRRGGGRSYYRRGNDYVASINTY